MIEKHLILHVRGNKYVNHSFFRPNLYIYSDVMIYKKRKKLIKVDEVTMPYNHVAQFNLHKGFLFSTMEIIMSGGNNVVVVKGIWNRQAKKAKKIIDEKVYHSHNKHPGESEFNAPIMDNIEKSLTRLRELVHMDRISEKEFEKRKKKIINSIMHK